MDSARSGCFPPQADRLRRPGAGTACPRACPDSSHRWDTELNAFSAAGAALILVAVAGVLTHRVVTGTADGLSALGFALIAVGRIGDAPGSAVLNSALAAYFAYRWWNGQDGDDGPRRRLRRYLRRFTAVRRAAPSHG